MTRYFINQARGNRAKLFATQQTLFMHVCASKTAFRFSMGSPIPMNTTFVTLCLNDSSIAKTCSSRTSIHNATKT